MKRYMLALALLTLLLPGLISAQDKKAAPPVEDKSIAATVNGEQILEATLTREMKDLTPAEQEKVRPAILKGLIDTMVVDQYLKSQKLEASEKDITDRLEKFKEEAKASKQTLEQVLSRLGVTETELRNMIILDLRWEGFLNREITDPKLETFFKANPAMFDGSLVRARHILIKTEDTATEEEKKAAKAKLVQISDAIKKEIAGKETDQATVEAAFSKFATQYSDCPSKKNGGDLGTFPRLGKMVEPFAEAAFKVKPGEMTPPVETQFGYHLILQTEFRKGKDSPKLEEVKSGVKEVYAEKLKEMMVAQLRQRGDIKILARKAK